MKDGENYAWFADNIQKMQDSMFRVSYAILHNYSDCEDAAGSAILAAYQNLKQLKDRHKFRAWFMRILKNECYSIIRNRVKISNEFEDQAIESDIGVNLDLHEAIMSLKEEYRIAIVLYHLEGYHIHEIAQILDVPTGTVKSYLSRARQALKNILSDKEASYETE